MIQPFTFSKCKLQGYQSYLLVRCSSFNTIRKAVEIAGSGLNGNRCSFSKLQVAALTSSRFLDSSSFLPTNHSAVWQRKHSFSSAISKEEEEKEKYRVSMLSPEQRKQELRELDQKIKNLNTLRGINTGELYTWRGQMKALARDYGIGFLAWYYTVWVGMFSAVFVGIEYGGVDALEIISQVDHYTGFDIATRISPTLGSAAVSAAINEFLEPIRLVFVVSTTKPIVKRFTERY